MGRCVGGTVVVESPTIPTFTEESAEDVSFTREAGALTISVGDDAQDPCFCGDEIVAITTVLYNGEFTYDGDAIYSSTVSP